MTDIVESLRAGPSMPSRQTCFDAADEVEHQQKTIDALLAALGVADKKIKSLKEDLKDQKQLLLAITHEESE